MKEEDVLQLLSDIRDFKKEFREKGNSYYDRISSKDVLFYFLNIFGKVETRVTKVETKQKIFMWLIPVSVSIGCLIVGVIL